MSAAHQTTLHGEHIVDNWLQERQKKGAREEKKGRKHLLLINDRPEEASIDEQEYALKWNHQWIDDKLLIDISTAAQKRLVTFLCLTSNQMQWSFLLSHSPHHQHYFFLLFLHSHVFMCVHSKTGRIGERFAMEHRASIRYRGKMKVLTNPIVKWNENEKLKKRRRKNNTQHQVLLNSLSHSAFRGKEKL